MKPTKSNHIILTFVLLSTFTTFYVAQLSAAPLGTAFTYQGRLNDGANAANGIYDLRFAICDSATNGSVVAGPLTNAAVAISNGLFTVTLDFGSGVFDGNARWLDISVRTNGGGAFATLTPRQALTATPYALEATTAASANTAMTAASVPASGIGSGTANINISGYSMSAISAAIAGSAATAATAGTAGNFSGTLSGDVTGTQTATVAERLRGVPISTNSPTANQHLRFDGTRWVPAAVALGTDVSGTLPDARLSANVALLTGYQLFSGPKSFDSADFGYATFSGSADFYFNANFWSPPAFNFPAYPFTVGSPTMVANLNADMVDGLHSNDLARAVHTHSAADIASGTLADARLSGNVPLLDMLTVNFTGKVVAYQFIGDGSPLTTLNASQLSSGTVPNGRLSGTYSSALTLSSPANIFYGDGSQLQNLNANYLNSGAIPSPRLTGVYSSPVTFSSGANSFSGTFNGTLTGNGSGLTSLNANNLTSGTVPDGRLTGLYSSAVTFSSGGNNFSGNGGGLTGLNANNLMSGFVPDGRLSGTYSSVVTFNNSGNSFSGNGSGLTGLNANNLASGTVPDARLSSNVLLLNGSPTFSSPVTLNSFLSVARTTIVPVPFGSITPTNSYILLNPASAITIGAIFPGARIGDILILQGSSDVNTVTIPNNANTKLTAANHVLGANDTLMLIWTGIAWTELAFANNL